MWRYVGTKPHKITLSKATGLNSKCFAAGRPKLCVDCPPCPRQCARKMLRLALRSIPEYRLAGIGGLSHGASEASLEAKASQNSVAGCWSRRGVICDGGRRRSDCADSKCAVARHRRAFRIRSRRRGNVRRQPGDILCLRQGKRPDTSGWRATCVGLQRLQRLQRLPSVQRLRRLRVRMLCVMGSLPLVLDFRALRLR